LGGILGFQGGGDDYIATGCARDGALDEEQVVLCIDAYDLQVLGGLLDIAHVTRHLLAFPYTTWALVLTDRARGAMRQRVTVGGILHAEIPALDDTLEAFALGDARYVYHLTLSKTGDIDFGARRKTRHFIRCRCEFPKTTP